MNVKIFFIILGAVLFFLSDAFFIVRQTEQAIVLEFGKPVKFKDGGKEVSFINSPGLKLKLPFVQDVVYFDNRTLNFAITDKEVLDIEKKTLTVNAFAKYKIVDPLTFYEKVTNERGINLKLDKIFEASMRDSIGGVLLSKLLTEERKNITRSIRENVSTKAKDFGVEVFDVRVVRADLPTENSNAIYKRMFAERNKEAREYRAQGQEEAKVIRSKAIKEATIIKANAEKQAQIIKGEGDSKATAIFANAFGRDPQFYDFYRTMQAYKKSINKEDTTLVLSPDSEFMRFFDSVTGK